MEGGGRDAGWGSKWGVTGLVPLSPSLSGGLCLVGPRVPPVLALYGRRHPGCSRRTGSWLPRGVTQSPPLLHLATPRPVFKGGPDTPQGSWSPSGSLQLPPKPVACSGHQAPPQGCPALQLHGSRARSPRNTHCPQNLWLEAPGSHLHSGTDRGAAGGPHIRSTDYRGAGTGGTREGAQVSLKRCVLFNWIYTKFSVSRLCWSEASLRWKSVRERPPNHLTGLSPWPRGGLGEDRPAGSAGRQQDADPGEARGCLGGASLRPPALREETPVCPT